VWEG